MSRHKSLDSDGDEEIGNIDGIAIGVTACSELANRVSTAMRSGVHNDDEEEEGGRGYYDDAPGTTLSKLRAKTTTTDNDTEDRSDVMSEPPEIDTTTIEPSGNIVDACIWYSRCFRRALVNVCCFLIIVCGVCATVVVLRGHGSAERGCSVDGFPYTFLDNESIAEQNLLLLSSACIRLFRMSQNISV